MASTEGNLRFAVMDSHMREIAAGLDKILNGEAKGSDKANGFVLLTFPFDGPEGARVNYISNAERADMLVALKEIVSRFEGQAFVTGEA